MNWFGYVVEPTEREFESRYGNLHNSGHGVFGGMVSSSNRARRLRSYMTTTVNAVRDPIFYRYSILFRVNDASHYQVTLPKHCLNVKNQYFMWGYFSITTAYKIGKTRDEQQSGEFDIVAGQIDPQ